MSDPLSWRFISTGTAIFGLTIATLTISGLGSWEGYLALAGLGVVAIAVVLRGLHRPVLHAFLTAFLGALLAIELQALFLPIYFANNPEYAQVEMPWGLSPRLATAVGAPINATLAGLVAAILTWLLVKLRGLLSG